MENLVDSFQAYLQGYSVLAFPLAFIAGVLISFTPCVYPVLPITVAYIGSQSKGSKLKGFFLSISYVFGMAFTYTALGAFAAFTGRMFGQIQTNPVTFLVIANICLLLGLSMLDVFAIPVPGFFVKMQPNEIKEGLFGSFMVGLMSGFIVGPCTAPVLGVLLSFIAASGDVVFGMGLLFVFSTGMGMLLLLLGTFTGFIANIPRSGKWMNTVKKFLGLVMIAMAEYFLVMAGKYFL